MYEALETIRQKCENCKKCPLYQTKTNTVFSGGTPNSKIMLIGEAPGEQEDLQGSPFVGRSGQLLDKILESIGLNRNENIYICNTIKCRPPHNRNPLPEEKSACREYLDAQLEILKPKIILLCGAVSVASMIPNNTLGITKIHGKWFDGPNGAKMMPIYHPAYLLRNPSNEHGKPKWQMWQDIKEVKRVYDEIQ